MSPIVTWLKITTFITTFRFRFFCDRVLKTQFTNFVVSGINSLFLVSNCTPQVGTSLMEN